MAAAILAAGWGTTCEAKLGMKMEDLDKAYRPPVSTNVDAGMVVHTHHVIGEEITVTYLDGVAVCESIVNGPDDEALRDVTAVEMAGIVAKKRDAKWERCPELDGPKRKAWSVGKEYYALWDFPPGKPERLTIYTRAYAEKSELLKKK